MKVEIELNNSKHACTGHVMACDETGRTIASFWHEGDAVEVMEAVNSRDKLLSENAELKKTLLLAWSAIGEAGYEDHCLGLESKIEELTD